MLNYIWLSLIVLGIGVAVGRDLTDAARDTYGNKRDLPLLLQIEDEGSPPLQPHRKYSCQILVDSRSLSEFYGLQANPESDEQVAMLPATLIMETGERGRLQINVEASAFNHWNTMAKLQGGGENLLQGTVAVVGRQLEFIDMRFRIDPIRFVTINRVTNEGLFRHARIAVELAIGLIGIMALWLGIMRIAEHSGLITKLANLLRPTTTRLFPDVPGDHPAMGAMIMNISANMLGLANAATPLGLKAMEELNKLNKKIGTATDAMCTFLVINTSNVQLIPATVIAIRAAAGSAHPTEIIGAVIVATSVSTVVGVTVVKLLGKLRFYKNQLGAESMEREASHGGTDNSSTHQP